MTRYEIMKAANKLIEELMWRDDDEFVYRVASAVFYGEQFTEYEIDEESDSEYLWEDDDDDWIDDEDEWEVKMNGKKNRL